MLLLLLVQFNAPIYSSCSFLRTHTHLYLSISSQFNSIQFNSFTLIIKRLYVSPLSPSLSQLNSTLSLVTFTSLRERERNIKAQRGNPRVLVIFPGNMSNSTEIGDAGRFSGFRPLRAAEKSSAFSQTCSLLSQYLKEKKTTFGVGDLSLGGMINTTNSDGKGMKMMMPDTFRQSAATTTAVAATTMDLFPQKSGFSPPSKAEVVHEKVTIHSQEPESAQMTIFYNGQVIVLNDFPAEKAKQIMSLAAKESSRTAATFPSPPAANHKPIEPCTINHHRRIIPASSSSDVVVSNNKIQQQTTIPQPKPNPQSPVTAIPIARKASLTRFLEKRKDRITTRAPYPVSSTSSAKACPEKPVVEGKSWLGLAAQYPVRFGHQL